MMTRMRPARRRPRWNVGIVLALGFSVSGCSSTNISELAKALATSEATVCGKLTLSTPWGTQTTTFARTNIKTGTVACPSEGGLSVKTTP